MFMYIFMVLICIIITLLIVKMILYYLITWNKCYTCLVGKTVIVTGANTGIGYWAALDFAKRGARVILACRNKVKAQVAQKMIITFTGNSNVAVELVDFTSLESVRTFCKVINEKEARLDILVNNAGALNLGDMYTQDGLQMLWQVNHFSSFLLTHLLINKLKKSAPSRIVIVASTMARRNPPKIDFVNTFISSKDYGCRYGYTKQANIMFARELARRLSGSNVNVHALHPGTVYTEISRSCSKYVIWFMNLLHHFFKTSEEGAQTTIYCAVSKDLEYSTGKLYEECSEVTMYKTCLDMNFAKQLWKKSEELVKLKSNEKIPMKR